MGESQGERELHLGKKEGSKWEHEVERVCSPLKECGFQGGDGGKAKRASLGEVGESISG